VTTPGAGHLLVTAPSLGDQAYTVLRDLVTSGELAPGERVTERALAGRLGVSPTPVREAIARLTHERLLVRVDRRTLKVAAPNLRRLREMSLIQATLGGVAARLAAEFATDEELAEIEQTHIASKGKAGRRGAREHPSLLRHRFHDLIVAASHSPSLIDMTATAEAFGRALRDRVQQTAGARADESIQHAADEHDAILAALRAHDGSRAEALMREHILWVNERYLEFAEELGLLAAAGESSLAIG
jgi:DNA-binding GntR family transcriptional regulator